MGLRWRIAQFFEIRWWQRYLRHKDKTAYLNWKRLYWQAFLSKINLDIPPHARILDAGCGPAGIFLLFPSHKVTAIDPLLDHYQRRVSHFKPDDYPNVRFISRPLETFSPEQPFDVVFCLNALNHVDDLQTSILRLSATVRNGGLLILSVDAHRYAWLRRIFQAFPGDILHPHQQDAATYERLFAEQGFKPVRSVLLKKEMNFEYRAWVMER